MPRLSVLMSAYKCGGTVRAAVTTTLRAMPSDAELRVVVDGPDAATEEALDSVADRRLVVRVDPVNKGLSRQLQLLSAVTDSEFTARMDADDICLPGRFRLTMPVLARADFVFASGVKFGNGPIRPGYPLPMRGDDIPIALLFFNPLFHPSMICRTAELARVGGYAAIAYGEDSELWTRAAAHGSRFAKIAAPAVAYRLSSGQMTAGNTATDRMTSDAAYMKAHAGLAVHMGLEDYVGKDGRLRLDEGQKRGLLGRVSPWNRPYIRAHLSSPLAN